MGNRSVEGSQAKVDLLAMEVPLEWMSQSELVQVSGWDLGWDP